MIHTDGVPTIANTHGSLKVKPHPAYKTALLDNLTDASLSLLGRTVVPAREFAAFDTLLREVQRADARYGFGAED